MFWGLTNQYDYLCSQCSCVCTTKTPICVWDIVRDEGMKNKWMKPRRLIYCHPADLKYLAYKKKKQWEEQRLNDRMGGESLVLSWRESVFTPEAGY